jgi:hypothetical protein
MDNEKIKELFYEYCIDKKKKENITDIFFRYFLILLLLLFCFSLVFGFPVSTIKCDKRTNQCCVYRNFLFKPKSEGHYWPEFHVVHIDKIQNVVTWKSSGGRARIFRGYNIGFELKDSKKNTFYGKERGDIHIRNYSLTRKTAEEFTTKFNQFLNSNEITKFNKTYIPLPIIEFLLIPLFTVLFKFHRSGIILVEDKEKYSLKEEVERILIYSLILLLLVIFVTFIIASFL